jgi:hypothetical protein
MDVKQHINVFQFGVLQENSGAVIAIPDFGTIEMNSIGIHYPGGRRTSKGPFLGAIRNWHRHRRLN